MFRKSFWSVALLAVTAAVGAAEKERTFDFKTAEVGSVPQGFTNKLTGSGRPGVWEIVLDDAPTAFPSVTGNAPQTSKRKVLAQTSRDVTDEHFPLLVFNDDVYDDFTFTAKVKMVGGAVEQMAGLAFRIQDEKNYYIIRASALGGNIRFYKFVNGERSVPLGPDIEVAKGVWHEISVECKGNRIRCLFNGHEAIPELTDTTFFKGKVGFWTKSDAVSYFTDARVSFRPREILARTLVREAMDRYPRLLGLQIFARTPSDPAVKIIASAHETELGHSGGTAEKSVIEQGSVFFGKGDSDVAVTMPLKDRNGDPMAAVKVIMKSFPGQTEANAVGRAEPVVRLMQARAASLKDLVE